METQITHINKETGFKPHIEGRRITVQQIAEYHYHLGWDVIRIADAFDLTQAQVYAALAYYHDNKDQIDEAIAADTLSDDDLPNIDEVLNDELRLIMTPQEIANEFPIKVDAVYQAVRRGKLRARKSGKTVLILKRDAEALWGTAE